MMKALRISVILLCMSLIVLSVYAYHAGWLKQPQTHTTELEPEDLRGPQPDPELYEELKTSLALKRKALAARYKQAPNFHARKEIIREARAELEADLPALMRCWLGTTWDFNGIATTPGEGKIACGYFVSTVMLHAGFDVNRVKLAQQASQNIIRTFVPRNHLTIKPGGMNYDKFISLVISSGPGIYIIGLDKHVGFMIVTDDNQFHYIHSEGHNVVVDESREDANTLQRSNYRVFGNLTAEEDTIIKWLTSAPFPTYGVR